MEGYTLDKVTAIWQLPTLGNMQYPVTQVLTTENEETDCGNYMLPAWTQEDILEADVRVFTVDGLVPGMMFNLTLR